MKQWVFSMLQDFFRLKLNDNFIHQVTLNIREKNRDI